MGVPVEGVGSNGRRLAGGSQVWGALGRQPSVCTNGLSDSASCHVAMCPCLQFATCEHAESLCIHFMHMFLTPTFCSSGDVAGFVWDARALTGVAGRALCSPCTAYEAVQCFKKYVEGCCLDRALGSYDVLILCVSPCCCRRALPRMEYEVVGGVSGCLVGC